MHVKKIKIILIKNYDSEETWFVNTHKYFILKLIFSPMFLFSNIYHNVFSNVFFCDFLENFDKNYLLGIN